MGVDEPGNERESVAVDHPGALAGRGGSDVGESAPLDPDVGPADVAPDVLADDQRVRDDDRAGVLGGHGGRLGRSA